MKHHWVTNRASFINALPSGASGVLIAGNGLVSRNADTTHAFRQDSNLLYISGLQRPGIAILGNVVSGRWYVIVPQLSKVEKIFDDTAGWDEMAKKAGFDDCMERSEAMETLQNLAKKGDIYFNVAPQKKYHGVYSNPHRADWQNYLRRRGVAVKDARPILATLRMVKQSYEVKYIEKAIAITNNVLDKTIGSILQQKAVTERMVANYITAEFYANGEEHAYLPIVASGGNATTLHHMPNDSPIGNNQIVLFDVGAEYNGYAADISRTIVVGDNMLQQQLIDDITLVQKQLIQSIKPGTMWSKIQSQAESLLADVAKKHDLLNNVSIKELFPHAIGHFLGLDVHDIGDYTQPLKENMVITVEPGIYSKLKNFGIRIEDDVLITKNGAKIL